MKFPIALPKPEGVEYPRLKLQIWDKDFFSPNDFISEHSMNLQPFLRFCEKYSRDKRCVMTKFWQDRFWLNMGERGENKGKIKVSVELLPEKVAKQFPAGLGRSEPNRNPFLNPPDGRAEFSLLNPCNSIRLLIGDKLCLKMVCFFLVLACTGCLIFITPSLISNIAANIITG